MDQTSKKDYRVIATVQVGPLVSREHVLTGGKDLTVKEIHDWLNHLSATEGITKRLWIGKAVNGFETPGLVPEEKEPHRGDLK